MIIMLNIAAGLVIAILGNLFATPLSLLLGSSEVLLKDCVTYLRWQLAFAPALMLQIQFQMYFVTEGRPGIGLFLTLLAGVANGNRLHDTGCHWPYLFFICKKLPVAGTSPHGKGGA